MGEVIGGIEEIYDEEFVKKMKRKAEMLCINPSELTGYLDIIEKYRKEVYKIDSITVKPTKFFCRKKKVKINTLIGEREITKVVGYCPSNDVSRATYFILYWVDWVFNSLSFFEGIIDNYGVVEALEEKGIDVSRICSSAEDAKFDEMFDEIVKKARKAFGKLRDVADEKILMNGLYAFREMYYFIRRLRRIFETVMDEVCDEKCFKVIGTVLHRFDETIEYNLDYLVKGIEIIDENIGWTIKMHEKAVRLGLEDKLVL